jgi:hypothetical protein
MRANIKNPDAATIAIGIIETFQDAMADSTRGRSARPLNLTDGEGLHQRFCV